MTKFIRNILINNRKELALILVTLCLVVVTSLAYHDKVFWLHFVDEEDNLVLGSYLLQGKKLYLDLFSHHQPLAYILSAAIQKVTDPNSIYLLIKRHREFIIVYSALWSLFLVARFGRPALSFVLLYELTKLYLLGSLFLAETLVTYPLVYLAFTTFKEKLERIDNFLIGFCVAFSLMMLAPVWPLLLFMTGVLILKFWNRSFKPKIFLFTFLPVILVSFYFSPLRDYIYNVFYINFKYYIPLTSEEPLLSGSIKAFLTPIIALLSDSTINPILLVYKILSLLLLAGSLYLLKLKKIREVAFVITVLGLANFRFIEPGLQIYRGFHQLPYYALFIGLTSLIYYQLTRKINVFYTIAVLLLATFLFTNYSGKDLFKRVDKIEQHYIGYSRQFDIGEAVRIMKAGGDTLFVAPDEWLVYWQAKIEPSSKMINYYNWMSQAPPLRDIVESTFNTPPAFVHLNRGDTGMEEKLTQYVELTRHGGNSGLYVRNDKLEGLRPHQIDNLKFLGYDID